LYDAELEVDKFDVWKYPKSWALSFPSLLEAELQLECQWWEETMGWDGRAPLSSESI
jgi:hypothetical protein